MAELQRNQRFAAVVKRLVEESNQTQVAQRARVAGGAISKVLNVQAQPSWSLTHHLAVAYPHLAKELFRTAGYPFPVDLIPGAAVVAEKLSVPLDTAAEEAVRRLIEGSGWE